MRKILIVGAKGMLGQELVKAFKKDKENKVIAWDKEDLNISSEKEVSKKIGFTKPNIIINATAYNAVDKCEEDKKEYAIARKINGLAPGYLARAAKKAKAILVHYSTDYVFNGEPEIPEPEGCSQSCSSCSLHADFQPEIGFDEKAKPKPISQYGKTKLLGEKEVEKNIKKFYLIRTSRLFGQPNLAQEGTKSFFEIMIELGKRKKKIEVVDEEASCFTYVPDLVKKTKEIVDSQKPFGIYHIVNRFPCTWYEAVVFLYEKAKIKAEVIPVSSEEFPRPAKRPYYSVLVNTKLNPLRDWRETLDEYLKIIVPVKKKVLAKKKTSAKK